ncbi:MAG TPA: TonB-dependent receptor, partial [Sphingomonadaceae bacterium]|nr:TonB-dependent receptor [Sphingomonadaceae bacterium]
LLPALKLTGGIRYSSDRKSRVGATVLDTLDSNGDVISRNTLQVNDASRDFSRTTWRVGVDYDSALGLIYASVATGYKAGGFNDGCLAGPSAPAQCVYTENELFYQPETLTAYEAGFKFRLTPEIRLNGSIFHYDYEGLQLSQLGDFGNCGLCQLTTNAAKAKVDGIELESVITPLQGLSINLSVNWLDARYAEFTPIPTVDFNGHPLARSPEWTWSAGFDYRYPLDNGGSLDLGARTRYSSSYDLTDLANLMYFRQPSYTRTDLTLTYNSPNDRLSIGVFARNLENNIVLTSAGFGSNGTGSDGTVSFADPRTVGVRVGVRY